MSLMVAVKLSSFSIRMEWKVCIILQLLTIAFEILSAFVVNIWYMWLLYCRRTPKTITANNLVPPIFIIAALSSVFWIVISLSYRWSLIWGQYGWPTPIIPVNDTRLLAMLSIDILLNWIIFFLLHSVFSRNDNGIAKVILDDENKED
uniref:TLC domain-containing protein n=1 Tax=Ascaris lumbricoides TaxID=6252 RepID=A0A0M3IH94_ASCLU